MLYPSQTFYSPAQRAATRGASVVVLSMELCSTRPVCDLGGKDGDVVAVVEEPMRSASTWPAGRYIISLLFSARTSQKPAVCVVSAG